MVKVFSEFKLILKSVFKLNELNRLKSSEVLLLSHDNDRSHIINGKKYATILDSLNFFLNKESINSINIATPISNYCGVKIQNEIYCINGIIIRAKIKQILFDIISLKKNENKNFLILAWSKIILKVAPKYIISTQPSPSLCIAAKNNNVLIFDFQHGVFDSSGYYGIKHRCKNSQKGWPNSILCWDQNSFDWVLDNCYNLTKPILVGNPWFIKTLNFSDSLLTKFYKKRPFFLKNKLKPNILISLQYGQFELTTLQMSHELIEFIIDNTNNFNFLLRIHPILIDDNVFKNKVHEKFQNYNNIDWEYTSNTPLPLILKEIDIHITYSSSLTIEASWFGIKTALLSKDIKLLRDCFNNQINSGDAFLINDSKHEIENWLIKTKNDNSHMTINKNDFSPDNLNKFIFNLKYNKDFFNLKL